MKKHIAYLGITTVLLLASCSSSSIDQKKSELESLKSQAKEIKKQIEVLEKEIAKMDTSAKSVKSKTIKTATVETSQFSHYIDLMGTVECEDNVLVNPKMGGLVTSVTVTEGQMVSAGQVLATVESSVLETSLAEIENQLDLARTVYEKQKRLWDQNIGTEIQYLQAKNNKESLEKRLTTTKTQLSLSRIVAPFSGVVDEVNIKVGETAAPGMGGIRVVNLNKMKIVAKVADAYASKMKKGDKVKISLPDIGINFESVISYAGLNVAPNSRTFDVEIKIPSNINNLRPNLLARISVNDGIIPNAIVIPLNVVQKSEDGSNFVMISENVNGKNIARTRTVKLGPSYDQNVVILEGLKSDDVIIIEGNDDLLDGQELSIVK